MARCCWLRQNSHWCAMFLAHVCLHPSSLRFQAKQRRRPLLFSMWRPSVRVFFSAVAFFCVPPVGGRLVGRACGGSGSSSGGSAPMSLSDSFELESPPELRRGGDCGVGCLGQMGTQEAAVRAA